MPTEIVSASENDFKCLARTGVNRPWKAKLVRERRGRDRILSLFSAEACKVYGAITFILEHPAEVEAYLKDQDRLLEEIKAQYPMPQDRIDRFERARKDAAANLA
jgi:hypothetical protein